MKLILFILFSSSLFAQNYSKAINEYQNGNINDKEFANIIKANSFSDLSELDILGEKYITSLKSDNSEVGTLFFPGIDKVIIGFINLIKNEKIKSALGFLFPGNKCSIEQTLIKEGARSYAEAFKMAGKEVPQELIKYLE